MTKQANRIATLWDIQAGCPSLCREAWWAINSARVRGRSNPKLHARIPSTWGTWTATLTRVSAGWRIELDDSWRVVETVVARTAADINAALARFKKEIEKGVK